MTEQIQSPVDPAETRADSQDQTDFKVTPSMIDSLRGTRPWALFLAILGFIAACLMLLSGLFSFVGLSAMSHHNPNGPFPFVLVVLLNIVAGLLYIVPSYLLFKYGTSIGGLLNYGGQHSMEQALSYQKSFWKFAGILSIISLVLAVLGIAAAITIPLLAHFRP